MTVLQKKIRNSRYLGVMIYPKNFKRKRLWYKAFKMQKKLSFKRFTQGGYID